MATVTDEQGLINNFPSEPTMYFAEAPSNEEKRSYMILGVMALVLVALSIFIATAVS